MKRISLSATAVSSAFALTGCVLSDNPSKRNADSTIQYPDFDRADIIRKWGYPAEVLIEKRTKKLGDYVVTWVYYIQDSDGLVSPVFFSFRQGKLISSNSFGVLNGPYRLMDTDKTEDLKLILSERDRIQKTWPYLD